MKTLLTIGGLCCSLFGFSQSSALLNVKGNSTPISPNGTLELSTTEETTTKVEIDLKNTGSATKSYIVTKNNVLLNTGANSYFCFALSCETFTTNVSTNTLVLNQGETASSLGESYMLTADLDESTEKGYSEVEYLISEVNNTKDNIKFTLIYNKALKVGLTKLNASLSSVSIFPNPSNGSTNLVIQSQKSTETYLRITNLLGEVVYEKNISVGYGANTVNINTSSLKPGIYSLNLNSADGEISKKLVVN